MNFERIFQTRKETISLLTNRNGVLIFALTPFYEKASVSIHNFVMQNVFSSCFWALFSSDQISIVRIFFLVVTPTCSYLVWHVLFFSCLFERRKCKHYDYVWPGPTRTRLHRTHSGIIEICPLLHDSHFSLWFSLISKPFVDLPPLFGTSDHGITMTCILVKLPDNSWSLLLQMRSTINWVKDSRKWKGTFPLMILVQGFA
jgi:hypothetical protein